MLRSRLGINAVINPYVTKQGLSVLHYTVKLEARLQLAQCKYLCKLTEKENNSWAHAAVPIPVESLEELFPWKEDRSSIHNFKSLCCLNTCMTLGNLESLAASESY